MAVLDPDLAIVTILLLELRKGRSDLLTGRRAAVNRNGELWG
jgi:hypothetical protein